MRSLIIATLVALPAVSGAASADAARMSRFELQRATECLAYANLAVLKDDRPDTAALDARVATEFALRPANTRNEVHDATRDIRQAGATASTPASVERLRQARARACSRFLDDTVQTKP